MIAKLSFAAAHSVVKRSNGRNRKKICLNQDWPGLLELTEYEPSLLTFWKYIKFWQILIQTKSTRRCKTAKHRLPRGLERLTNGKTQELRDDNRKPMGNNGI